MSLSRRLGRHEYKPLHEQDPDESPMKLMNSVSYRRRRAKQRRIFLGTYKLSSLERLEGSNKPSLQGRRQVLVKVKKVIASVVFSVGIASFRSYDCKQAISVVTPSRLSSVVEPFK